MRPHLLLVAVVVSIGAAALPARAQDEGPAAGTSRRTEGPWFGVALPPAPDAAPAVVVGTRTPRPVALAADPRSPELSSAALVRDLETIVGFSKRSRADREIGSGQIWGRVAGLPSADHTVAWAADQLRKAGIADVRMQEVRQDARAGLWLPLSWEVRLLGDAGFGAGVC